MENSLAPAAQDRYDTYLNHVRRCPDCRPVRCRTGQALVRAYLTTTRAERSETHKH
ncbi:hypothetical protein ABZ642_07080 [Streptomyces sp. NPDC007157]|uniref:hypothetical protein n=1 Tax=Streptomyces sp. NPDC007157 TaxID=3154681 RepID=UPI0033D1A9F6